MNENEKIIMNAAKLRDKKTLACAYAHRLSKEKIYQ